VAQRPDASIKKTAAKQLFFAKAKRDVGLGGPDRPGRLSAVLDERAVIQLGHCLA